MDRHHWTVCCAIPTKWNPGDTKECNRNHRFGVVADTIDDAIGAVRAQYPRCTIMAVNHAGLIQLEVPPSPPAA